MPVYVAKVHVHPETAKTGPLAFQDHIAFVVKDDDQKPVPNADYRVFLADGQIRKGTVDGSGRAEEDDVPPGPYRIAPAPPNRKA